VRWADTWDGSSRRRSAVEPDDDLPNPPLFYSGALTDVMHVADGTRVLIRPVLPQDLELMEAS
jgi:hypothetical protein